MDRSLEEIEFLARSHNRVECLEALSAGPRTRSELAAETGASQPTLGRILRDFEDRRWVERREDGYVATATGRLVAEGIVDLREILETEAALREVIEWLPAEAMAVDLRELREATITTPTRTRPGAPASRVGELLADADRIRAVSHAFNERSLSGVREATVEGGGSFAGVFSRAAIDAVVDDAPLCRRLRELIDAPDVSLRVVEREIPLAVTVVDDVVALLLRDDDGILQAALEVESPAAHGWAVGVHERYWEAGAPLDAADLVR